MKKSDALMDDLLRAAYKIDAYGYLVPMLRRARRFVLDDSMSQFLAPLSTEAFLIGADEIEQKTSALSFYEKLDRLNERIVRMLDGLRMQAKAPHAVTWIEYDFNKRFARYMELYDDEGRIKKIEPITIDTNSSESRCGWLIEQHATNSDLYRLTVVFSNNGDIPPVAPFSIVWSSNKEDHRAIGWGERLFDDASKEYLHLFSLDDQRSNFSLAHIVTNELSPLFTRDQIVHSCNETRGELRYVWALLASINDLPVGIAPVSMSKGFVARGAYRKFLDRNVITLTLPKRMSEKRLARTLVAISRRRAHEVRGHFRRVGPDKVRKWIAEHVRGDASLGWVTHDYKVTREDHAK